MVNTKLKNSKIAGIGLFADQLISKGDVVWKFEPSLDALFDEDQIAFFSESSRKQFYNYAFLDNKYNKWMLCGDDGRFFNHSEEPNCDDSNPDTTIAMKNILPGEELTVNYKTFYGDIERISNKL
jgi:SET domain-containing protein